MPAVMGVSAAIATSRAPSVTTFTCEGFMSSSAALLFEHAAMTVVAASAAAIEDLLCISMVSVDRIRGMAGSATEPGQSDVVVVKRLHFVYPRLPQLKPSVAELQCVHHALVIGERHERVIPLGQRGRV